MIAVTEVVARLRSVLDDEGSERYTFDQDLKPAINSAIEDVVSIINSAMGENKLSAEKLIDLIRVGVWQANSYSRFAFNPTEVGHDFWTALAIYPKPKTNKKNFFPAADDNNSESKFMPDISFVDSTQSARRLNFEQWNENQNNVFVAGNMVLSGSLQEYAYLDAADYSSTSYTSSPDKKEWTIRPSVANQLVAMVYVKYPTPVTLSTDSLEFPKSLTEMIVNLAAKRIGYKQGTQSLYVASAQDIAMLVKAIM